jgi:two-component system, NarL family, sensor kinase
LFYVRSMKQFLLAFTLFLSVVSPLFSQSKLDSMLNHIPLKQDTVRVQALNNLCFELAFSEPDQAKQYGRTAFLLSEKLSYTLGKAKALNRLGIVYDVSGMYDSAMYCYQQAGIFYNEVNNLKGKASALNNIGLLYAGKGHYKRALGNYYTALKLFEQLGNPSDIASAYNNIGSTYSDLLQFNLAFIYYQKAATINKEHGNMDALASNYTNIASSLRELGKYDSALAYVNMAIPIEQELNSRYGLGLLYNILGTTYSDMGKHRLSAVYLEKSLAYRKEIHDVAGETSGLLNLSGQYSYLNEHQKALNTAYQAHELALQNNNYRMLRKTSQLLFFLYNKAGQYKKAAEFVELSWSARDSAMSEESAAQIAEMEVKYDTEKQELELEKKNLSLANAQLEIERKQGLVVNISIVSLLLLLIGLGSYKRYQHQQQRKFDAHILLQQEQRNKAIIEAEEKERIRIARELHDGIGQQLSAAKMNLSALEHNVAEKDKEKFQSLMTLVDEAVTEVRSVSHNMMPNALIRSGLVSAVRDFIHKINSSGPLKIDLSIVGLQERLDATTESVLYRVLQENISNIIKHANATQIGIQLMKHETHLNMMIEDNGIGFDTKLVHTAEGIGLKNMVSRIQFLNGTIEFDSTIGKGTSVIIDIPLS